MIIKSNQEDIQSFLTDASNFKGACKAVYIPENKEEIISILREANASGTKVTVAGNGTGLTGARVPLNGIVISTEKLNKIIEINTKECYAIVEPAVILSDLLNELKSLGFFYPPDPTEKNCFIGGTVATNASGAKTFKYGPTRNYIEELEVILADGQVMNLVRGKNKAVNYNLNLITENGNQISLELPEYKLPLTKNAAGYFTGKDADAIDLFVGSEGTLGIFSKMKLKILPLPARIISAVFYFDREKDALNFIENARMTSKKNRDNNICDDLNALALEYFDFNALVFLKSQYPNIPDNSRAAVWLEQEADLHNEEILLDKWNSFLISNGGNENNVWFAVDERERERISEFRHAVSAKVNEYISRNNFKKLGTDVAVPDHLFRSFYDVLKLKAEKSGLDYLIYGHFGNSHIHLNLLPRNNSEYLAGRNVYLEICDLAIEYGGTISAEHGVGKLKREYLERMLGKDVIDQMRKVKRVLDPNFLLGEGNIFTP